MAATAGNSGGMTSAINVTPMIDVLLGVAHHLHGYRSRLPVFKEHSLLLKNRSTILPSWFRYLPSAARCTIFKVRNRERTI